MMYFDPRMSTTLVSVSTNPTRTVDTLKDQKDYSEMHKSTEFIQAIEFLRDESSDIASTYIDGSPSSTKMRAYLQGMSDALAATIALLVDGDPNIAMESNGKKLMEKIIRRVEDGEED